MLKLTSDERDQLMRWSRRAESSLAFALRAGIVLACGEGWDNKTVAAKLGVSQPRGVSGGAGFWNGDSLDWPTTLVPGVRRRSHSIRSRR